MLYIIVEGIARASWTWSKLQKQEYTEHIETRVEGGTQQAHVSARRDEHNRKCKPYALQHEKVYFTLSSLHQSSHTTLPKPVCSGTKHKIKHIDSMNHMLLGNA